MPPKDKTQQNIAKLRIALKEMKGFARNLQAIDKKLRALQTQSKRLMKK